MRERETYKDGVRAPENGSGVRFKIADSQEEFEETKGKALKAEDGVLIADGLDTATVSPVSVARNDLFGHKPIGSARSWAKANILGDYSFESGEGDFRITSKLVDKYCSSSSIVKYEDNPQEIAVHLSVLKQLPEVVANSIDVEIHPDYKKGENGKRSPENGIDNENMLVHRRYALVEHNGELYRVKITVDEYAPEQGKPIYPHAYEVSEIELGILGKPNTPNLGANLLGKPSFSVAKLLNGVEKTFGNGKIFTFNNTNDVSQAKIDRGSAPTAEQRALGELVVEQLRACGIEVSLDETELADVLEATKKNIQKRINQINKAVSAIRNSISTKQASKGVWIDLPIATRKLIKKKTGLEYDEYRIALTGVLHGKNNHGVGGHKIDETSIPLRDEDLELAPYIIVAPDDVQLKVSEVNNPHGLKSLLFIKRLSNGHVVVVEREIKNNPHAVETTNMWADLSPSNVSNARRLNSASLELQDVRNVIISSEDVAKIREDAETAIKMEENSQNLTAYNGGGRGHFDEFDEDYLGSQEGDMGWGYGFYFSTDKELARDYADYGEKGERQITGVKMPKDSELLFTGDDYVGSRYRLQLHPQVAKKLKKLRDVIMQEKNIDEFFSEKEEEAVNDFLAEIKERGETLEDYEDGVLDDIRSDVRDEFFDDLLDFENKNGRAKYDTLVELAYDLRPEETAGDRGLHLEESERIVSEWLRSVGIKGTKYSWNVTQGRSFNYAISDIDYINSNITSRRQFLRTRDGEVYGLVKGGKVYLDPRLLNANTPIHEYTHLWDTMVRQNNPALWSRGKDLMKQLSLWEEIKSDPAYTDIANDDDLLASEVHSRLSGAEGARLLEEMMSGSQGSRSQSEQRSLITRVKEWLRDMMQAVKDTFARWTDDEASGVSLDEFVRMPLRDLFEGKQMNIAPEELPVQMSKVTDKTSSAPDGSVRFRFADDKVDFDLAQEEKRLEEVNKRFNEELQQQIDGTLSQGHVYRLGRPGAILRAAGFPDLPIELSAKHLAQKATQGNHEFDISDMRNLVKAINRPLAVFAYGDKTKAQNVIVEIERDGKKFVVGVHFNQERDGIEVNSIRGLFNKNNHEWLNWITQEKLTWVDKEKIQALMSKQQTNLADLTYLNLDRVAKIVEDFENPSVLGEKSADVGEIFTFNNTNDISQAKIDRASATNDGSIRFKIEDEQSAVNDQSDEQAREEQTIATLEGAIVEGVVRLGERLGTRVRVARSVVYLRHTFLFCFILSPHCARTCGSPLRTGLVMLRASGAGVVPSALSYFAFGLALLAFSSALASLALSRSTSFLVISSSSP